MTERSSPTDSIPIVSPWHVVRTLCWREIVRFFRQRNRVIGAVGQPILFWLLFGAGLQQSFRLAPDDASGMSFFEYYFPGTLILILLFTAIFATISIIEDRREGFLQSVLVAPIPRWSMVLGKVLGGTLIAVAQGVFFLFLALVLRVDMGIARCLALVVLLFVIAFGLTSLGFVLAWRMESTQGFHAIMNLILMPMWLLSGAFFPIPPAQSGAAMSQLVLHWCMRINPVSYGVAGVRRLLYSPAQLENLWSPELTTCWAVTIGFAAVTFAACWKLAGKNTTGDLL
jgi:ABC-2 type transport system permease protein